MSTIRRGMRVPSAASGARRKARSTHAACATGVRPRSAAASRECLGGLGRGREVGRPQPWISIEDGAGAALGWTSPLTAAPASARPSSTGTPAKDDLVAFEVEPGRLDVHDEEARCQGSPAAHRALRPLAADPALRAIARKASFSAVRVTDGGLFGAIRLSGGRPSRSCST